MDYLNIDLIKSSSDQPRKVFDPNEMDKLAESIKEYGILEPLLVAPAEDGENYNLVAGERRLRAARIASLEEVPVVILEEFEGAAAQTRLEIALIENIQRVDLNPLEKARAYQHLIDEYGLTHDELAAKMSVHRSTISNTLRLLKLPENIQHALMTAAISERQAMSLLTLYELPAPLLKKAEAYIYSTDLHPTEIVKKVLSGASSDYVREKIGSIINSLTRSIIWGISTEFAVPDDKPAQCADCESMIYREANNLCGDESCFYVRLSAYHAQRLPLPEPTPTPAPAAPPVPYSPIVDKNKYPVVPAPDREDDDDDEQEGETEIRSLPVVFSYSKSVPIPEPETFADEKAIEEQVKQLNAAINAAASSPAPAEGKLPWEKCDININLVFDPVVGHHEGRFVRIFMLVNGRQILFDAGRERFVLMPSFLVDKLLKMEKQYNQERT